VSSEKKRWLFPFKTGGTGNPLLGKNRNWENLKVLCLKRIKLSERRENEEGIPLILTILHQRGRAGGEQPRRLTALENPKRKGRNFSSE